METPSNSGIYVSQLTSTADGDAVISVTVGGTTIAGVASQTVKFTVKTSTPAAQTIDATKSTFTAAPKNGQQLYDDGNGGSVLTFTAKDSTGAIITGLTDITFASSMSGAVFAAVTEKPANSGIYIGKLTSTKAGGATVKVQKGGADIAGVASQTVTFTHKAGAISGAKSSLTVDPAALSSNTASVTIKFQANDSTGAPVPGLTDIKFTKSGSIAASATIGTVTEDSAHAGLYTATLTNSAQGTTTIGVSQGTTAIAGVATVDVVSS